LPGGVKCLVTVDELAKRGDLHEEAANFFRTPDRQPVHLYPEIRCTKIGVFAELDSWSARDTLRRLT
jgi:hypothetical protein